jgi:hypothetical protein
MPMKREDYENLLNELLVVDLEQSKRTEILQKLRVDYGTVHADFEKLTTANERFQKDNDDLVVANSKLFRELGYVGTKDEKKEEEKEFSQTVTIEDLERGAK